mgnify:CR=1 FL=1|jgi:hypothetical protein
MKQEANSGKALGSYTVSNPVFQVGTTPSNVERPENVEELQELVKKANENKNNLVPVSSTGPHQKSGIACKEKHTIIDFSGWKKIPWVNRRNRVAMIEPGVTYGELSAALEPEGMTLPAPLAPRSGKSVLASLMDREPHIWPNKQWDYVDPLASTELMFGTGDIFRTGSAGGPGTLEQQREKGGAQKNPEGPSQTNFQRVVQGSQGSMGLVSWITVRTELKPSTETPFLIGSQNLEKLTNFVYEVQRPGLGEETFILDKMAAAMLVAGDDQSFFDQILDGLPNYICLQNIAGFEYLPKERVAYQLVDIKIIAKNNNLDLLTDLGPLSAEVLLNNSRTTSGELDWRQKRSGQCLSLFFMTTLDKLPTISSCFEQVTAKHFIKPEHYGTYIQPLLQNHACQVEFVIPFDPTNDRVVSRLKQLEAEGVDELIKAGAFFSRPYGSAELAAFKKNPVSYDFLKKTKHLFDPNRILNPGKFGL